MGKKKTGSEEQAQLILPFIALENFVMIPMISQPVRIDSEEQRQFLEKSLISNNQVFIITSDKKGSGTNEPKLREVGMICKIEKFLQMPGAPSIIFVTPLYRALFENIVFNPDFPMAKLSLLPEVKMPRRLSQENKLTLELIEESFSQLMRFAGEIEKATAEKIIAENSQNELGHLYAMVHVSPLSWNDKYHILTLNTFNDLISQIATLFDETEQKINIQAAIHEKTHHEINRQQKENFLRIHLKNVQEELGESEHSDIESLEKKAAEKKWSDNTKKHFEKELNKLRRLNMNNPDYSVQYSYLEAFLDLPWNSYSNKKISLDKVEEILERDHYGLEKVKERILEQMAVIKLRNDLKAPILCLFGPPGVGKTSIGKSIAEATGREYVRISLGGLHDEAEIRGHRRTYIGAMPGRFLHSLSKCKNGNPLFLLDEIDKVGKDYKGDPSSALLEALDPEQNNTFHDNYIDFPYDLSKVLFIATANDISTIPAPLRDRMEIIEMTGYIPEEKREIALRHLVNKSLADNGFKKEEIKFEPDAIDAIIRLYTKEAGVRQLEKKIGKILRKIAVLKAKGEKYPILIDEKKVYDFLGKKEYSPENYENNDFAGVATGLAWTPAGGDILFIETSLAPGKGDKISLTGNLGDVMKESATIAVQYLKANAEKLGIEEDKFNKFDIHIHVPEGAVPKDGPSAGITLASSILSAFSGRKMRERTAMTGEITLRGKVLPVGGIKEKIIAARQAGINRIILSKENEKDIQEILPKYIEGMEFIYVNTLPEVFEQAIIQN